MKRTKEQKKIERLEYYYKVNVKCLNCGFQGNIQVIKGKRLDLEECPHCGCGNTLVLVETPTL